MASQPDAASARVTVDGRYQLFLNGCRIGRGPIRCNPQVQSFDTYDLREYVKAGPNVIGLLIHTYGVDCAWYELGRSAWTRLKGDGAFWFESDFELGGATMSIDSDAEWRCLECPAWTNHDLRRGHGLGFVEQFDANEFPVDWLDPAFDDGLWDRAAPQIMGEDQIAIGATLEPFPTLVERPIPALFERQTRPLTIRWARGLRPNPDLAFNRRCYEEVLCDVPSDLIDGIESLKSGDGAASIATLPDADVAILLDFGKIYAGYPFVEFEAAGGEIIDIAVSEGLAGEWSDHPLTLEARIAPTVFGSETHMSRVVARPGRQRFEWFEWDAVKWLQLTVRNAPQAIKIRDVGVNTTGYPFEHRGSFTCDDPFLEKLWNAGAYTVELCAHDGWEDCPSREQRQWLGDAAVEHLVAQAAFGPSAAALNANYLRQVAESQRADGLMEIFAPGDAKALGMMIPDWTLHWILNAADHYLYTADLATIEAIFPAIQRALAWFDHYMSPSGLVSNIPHWPLLDWASVGRHGECCTLNALLAGSYAAAANLAEQLETLRVAQAFKAKADSMRGALNARHWDDRRGCYVDVVDPSTGKQEKRVSQHANAAMALWGGAATERRERSIARITDTERLVFTSAPPIVLHSAEFDDEEDVVLANTFFSHFVYSALADNGHLDDAISLMRARLGPIIDKGSATLWESLEPSASLCHGFSASPTYQLSSHILGVRPALPGFSSVRFAPNLGKLSQASGTVPTCLGDVQVELESLDRGFRAAIDAPAEMIVHAEAPAELELVDGPVSFRGSASLIFRPIAR